MDRSSGRRSPAGGAGLPPKAGTTTGAVLAGGLVALSLSAALMASPASAQSLGEALASAYNTNPTLNSARAQARATDENLPQAMANYRPQISGSVNATATGNYGTQWNSGYAGTTLPGSGQSYPISVGLNLVQPLFRGFRTTNSVKQAEAAVSAARDQLRDTEQSVLLNASSAYMNVIQQEAMVELQLANLSFLNEQLKSSQERFKVGEGTNTDVAQAQAGAAQAEAAVNAAKANLNAARATFRQIIGIDPKKLSPKQIGLPLRPKSLSVALQSGQSEHPAIQAAQSNVDVASYNVKVLEGNVLPEVNLQAGVQRAYNYAYGNATQSARQQDSAQVGVNVNIPIYTAGLVSSQVRQAKENLGYAQIQVDLYRDQVRQAVVAAWGNLQAAEASIIAARTAVVANQLAVNGVVEEQKVGQATTLDVLQQQSDLVQARTTLAQAEYAQAVAFYTLLAASGRLDAERLHLAVSVYKPSQHYEAVRNKWHGMTTPDGR